MSQKTIITENFDEESKKFVEEDYKLKVTYLQSHFSRMWTRFNFFLTIELALFGFLGYLLFDPKGKSVEATNIPIFLGFLTSTLWYFVGSQDRYLVEAYREDVKGIARIIADLQDGLAWYADYYVGSGKRLPQPFGSNNDPKKWWEYVTSWYSKYISITRLAAIIPLVLIFIWLIFLILRLKGYFIFSYT